MMIRMKKVDFGVWILGKYEDSIFLNLGLEYRPVDSLTIRVDGYNLLGCFDSDLNQRINWNGPSLLRSEAPGIGVTMSYRF